MTEITRWRRLRQSSPPTFYEPAAFGSADSLRRVARVNLRRHGCPVAIGRRMERTSELCVGRLLPATGPGSGSPSSAILSSCPLVIGDRARRRGRRLRDARPAPSAITRRNPERGRWRPSAFRCRHDRRPTLRPAPHTDLQVPFAIAPSGRLRALGHVPNERVPAVVLSGGPAAPGRVISRYAGWAIAPRPPHSSCWRAGPTAAWSEAAAARHTTRDRSGGR
jgi:hypothetical protein